MLSSAYRRVKAGETVTIRPRGNSMTPRIESGDAVTIAPCGEEDLKVGDVVLVRVAGATYVHLISAIDPSKRRVQISNNHGKINGWASYDKVAGKADK